MNVTADFMKITCSVNNMKYDYFNNDFDAFKYIE